MKKYALIVTLFDGFGDLLGRFEEREGQRQNISTNSSKPPSSDGLKNNAAEHLVHPVKMRHKVSWVPRSV